MPGDPYWIGLPLVGACATRSVIERAGDLALTTTTFGTAPTKPIDARSLRSYAALRVKLSAIVSVALVPSRMVWPSGALLATARAPMVLPAPPRLSIRIGCLRASLSRSEIARAITLVLPPGVNGTISVIGFEG